MEENLLLKIGILPKYTEISLFLISATLILLFITNSLFREEFFSFFFSRDIGKGLIAFCGFFVGMIFSIYHTFSKRPLKESDKTFMLIFGIVANVIAGICGGFHALKSAKGIWMIFPIFNIGSSVLLVFLWRYKVIKEDAIEDIQAKKIDVVLGVIFVLLIFFISQYIFKNYWAITFSLCTFYSTNLLEASRKIIEKYI
jgi:hypothetical protein